MSEPRDPRNRQDESGAGSGERNADSLHLPRRFRSQLEHLIERHLPDVEVWAYGSRINGHSHEGSDLDLVLRGSALAPIDTSALVEFVDALRDSTIPFLVEARDWARLPETFHRQIEREYVVFRRAPGGTP